jgi:hypothetical protein
MAEDKIAGKPPNSFMGKNFSLISSPQIHPPEKIQTPCFHYPKSK